MTYFTFPWILLFTERIWFDNISAQKIMLYRIVEKSVACQRPVEIYAMKKKVLQRKPGGKIVYARSLQAQAGSLWGQRASGEASRPFADCYQTRGSQREPARRLVRAQLWREPSKHQKNLSKESKSTLNGIYFIQLQNIHSL